MNKHMNKKSGLMRKFLIPFAVFLAVVSMAVYFVYTPQYRSNFMAETNLNMKAVKEDVIKWVSSFNSEISVIESYTKSNIDYENMLISFSNIVNGKDEIEDVYFANTIPYSAGGTFISILGASTDYDQTKRDWYIGAVRTNGIFISEPYVDIYTGIVVVTFAKAVYTNNYLKGVVGIDVSFSDMNEIMTKYSDIEKANINISTRNGIYVTHKDKEYVLNEQTSIFSQPLFSDIKNEILKEDYTSGIKGKEWYAVQKIDNTPWMIVGYGSINELRNQIIRLLIVLLIVVVSFMSLETVLVLIIVRPLSESLNHAINNIKNMAKGDFNARFEKYLLDKKDQTGYLTHSIDDMQKNVGSIIYKIKDGIDVINNAIAKISEGSVNLSDRSNSQAAALEELASSIEALSSAIKETAKSASEAKDMSSKASIATKSGVEAVIQTSNNMKEISESSRQISDITKMIQSIAFQTNILALNAAVEAARAGEQGKGFAVVASEIRSLAQTVTDAASNIANIVENTVNKIEHGNVSVIRSSELLGEIEKAVNEVSEVLANISNAVIQEEDSIGQINQAVIELNNITQENSNLAQESAFSSREVSDRTENMVEEISYFKFKNEKVND